jgi:hypothetical protein
MLQRSELILDSGLCKLTKAQLGYKYGTLPDKKDTEQ